jgi:SAM-dependent methyltransferase
VLNPPDGMGPPGGSFEALADHYDDIFTRTMLGGMYRQVVWDRLAQCLRGDESVLELNCGTGADAVWLAQRGHRVHATDLAPAMVARTRAAANGAGLNDLISTEVLAAEDLHVLVERGRRYGAVLSDFGGLNCVLDLRPVLQSMARILEPGGLALLVIMGRVVPWEWLWFLTHRQPRRAVRRLVRQPRWRGQPLRYHLIGSVQRAAAPALQTARIDALGALTPPPYSEHWARRHPGLVDRLNRMERRWSTNRVLVRGADHYVLELRRR